MENLFPITFFIKNTKSCHMASLIILKGANFILPKKIEYYET